MKSTIFILLFAIGGSMGQALFHHCKKEKCDGIVTPEDLESLQGKPPTEADLKTLCPKFLKLIECGTNFITECSGLSLEELAQSTNETIAKLMGFISGLADVTVDLCNEDSRLHKNYVSSVSCFTEKFVEIGDVCLAEGQHFYEIYKEASLPELLDDEYNKEGECLIAGYGMACATMQLRKQCSEATSETFFDIIKRTKITKLIYCDPQDVLTLKTKFLDFLEEQGEERDVFAAAFDFRRRK